jgi:murein DD-endopeptidase MepM/ murein hydrolase activator NlpD
MPLALLVLLGLTLLVLPMTAAALPVRAGPADPEPRFSWPLTPVPSVTRPFEAPADPYGPGHRGVDLGGAAGQQVLAAGPGVVVFAGPLAGRGVLSIDHDGGLRTTYEPVTPLVAAGDQVYRGQPVATLDPGHPGCPVAACVHWAVRRGEEYLNPLELIQVVTALRLKPWEGGDAGEPLIRSGR